MAQARQLAVSGQWGHVIATFQSWDIRGLKYGGQSKLLYQDTGS